MQQEQIELQGKLLIDLWTKLCHKYPGKGKEQTMKEFHIASLYSESQRQQGIEIQVASKRTELTDTGIELDSKQFEIDVFLRSVAFA